MGERSGRRSDRELSEAMGSGARRRRGIWIAEITPEAIKFVAGSKWGVKAQSRSGNYDVDIFSHTCSCPDHSEKGNKCKHQYAVETLLAKQNQARNRRGAFVENFFISYLLEEVDVEVPWIRGCRVRVTTSRDLFEVIQNGRRTEGSIKTARNDGFMGLALVLDEQRDGYFLVNADDQKTRCKGCSVRIPNSGELANAKGIYSCWPCWKKGLSDNERAAYVDLPRREYIRICDEQIVEALQERMHNETPRLEKMRLGGRMIYSIEASAAWTRELRRRKTLSTSSIVCQGDHPLDL